MIKLFGFAHISIFLCLFRVSCDIFEICPDNFSDKKKQMSHTDCQLTDLFTYFGNGKHQVVPKPVDLLI